MDTTNDFLTQYGIQDLAAQSQPENNGGDFLSQYGLQDQAEPTDPWQNFTQKATQISQERNFPSNVLLGQAALESGRGTSNFAKGRNNFFGYQAYDSNPDAAAHFSSPEEGVNKYIDLITQTPRYAWAYEQYLKDHDASAFVHNIWSSGYATDPNYVSKVTSTPEFQGGQ